MGSGPVSIHTQPRFFLSLLVLLVVALSIPAAGEAAFTPAAQMTAARAYHAATLLPTGKLLISGGYGNGYLSSSELYDPFRNTFAATGSMTSSRHYHSATPLPNGKVLVAGGSIDGAEYFTTTELYDSVTGTYSMGPSMSSPRNSHTATLLLNGKVLIAGGFNGTSTLASAEIYDPATNTFSATATTMLHARYSHTATLLSDGRVLIAGGYAGSAALRTAEIFDPATGTFSSAGSMAVARFYHTATLLRDGSVLVAGGSSDSAILTSAERFAPGTNSFTTVGNLGAARYFHSATLLTNGRILIIGGRNGNNFLNSAELFDPSTASFSYASGSLLTGRYTHTAILLPSGKVLVAGGSNVSGSLRSTELYDAASGFFTTGSELATQRVNGIQVPMADGRILIAGGSTASDVTASAEIYDPNTGTATPTGSMNIPRRAFAGALLATGKIVIMGGNDGSGTVNSAELYDPVAGTFTSLSSMTTAREGHTATVLSNGRILVAGGTNATVAMDTAEVFDPARLAFTAVGPMTAARTSHTAVLLSSGKVLVAGGRNSQTLRSADLFDPATATFTATGSMSLQRHGHTAVPLPSGKVLIAGGSDGTAPLASSEIYDPSTGMFSTAATMADQRQSHAAVLLQSGSVVIAGGIGVTGPLALVEVFDPITNTFTAASSMSSPRESHGATLLANGKVLIAGGRNLSPLSSTEVFDAGLGFSESLRPVVTSFAAVPGKPSTFAISGNGFMGSPEGSTGATNNGATNFPLLQLQEIYSNLTSFIRPDSTAPWTDTSFTTASTYGLPMGYYRTRLFNSAFPARENIIRLAPSKTVSPATVAFGEGGVNHTSPSQPVTIGNAGNADLLITELSMSGTDAAMFTVTPGTGCSVASSLGQNGACDIAISFTAASAGSKEATLSLATNDPDNPFATVSLSGTGVPVYVGLSILAGTGGSIDISTGGNCRGACTSNILEGSPVTLTALPDATYLFGGWNGCDAVSGTLCSVTMNAEKSVVATFIATYPLTINTSGGGSGSISISTGDTCSSYPCTKTMATPTVVNLTATAGPASTFAGWTGCDSVNGSVCTVTMTGAKNVSAAFEASYDLTVTIGGAGTGSVNLAPGGTCTENCAHTYVNGTTVILTAAPGEGFNFAGWSGCDSSSGSTCTVTMTAPKHVTATFSSAQNLSITIVGTGSVTASPGTTCGKNCSQTFPPATVVQLTAAPGANSTFSGWSGCDSVTDGVCTVTMNAAHAVTATFISSYQLSLNFGGIATGAVNFSTGGSCTGACIKTIVSGTDVTLTAVPDSTATFDSWLGCDSTNGTECRFNMTGGRIITVSFSYPISVSGRLYGTIASAYESAGNLETIKMRVFDQTGDVDLNRRISVTLAGGYDTSFTNVIGQTNIVGKLTVSSGTATLDNVVIR